MRLESSNPALAVARNQAGSFNFGGEALAATISGTTSKAILLVAITLIVGAFTMNYTIDSILYSGQVPSSLMTLSVIAGVIVAFVTIFKPNLAPITAPIYAVLEGAALGSLSALFEFKYPGIVTTAVMSTFVVVMCMLGLWKFKVIVPTQKFKAVITGAVMGICVLYVINMIVSLFGGSFLPNSGPLSILISLIVCTVAALSLILDFDNIEQSVNAGLPKYFEFYNAFSILVTICWLYVEILKLLSKRE